jgi:2-polyprenyl-3-methyl-5-hydroxy-6-metoxy-1,4-benzoquinol methylase
MPADSDRVAFWNRLCAQTGHTGYSDELMHRYDQPLRLRAVRRTLSELYPGGMAGARALDIGCGVGDFVSLLRELGTTVLGLDMSPAAISRAQARFASDALVSLTAGEIGEVALPEAHFDVITSVTVLQHLVDDGALNAALTKLRRTLRPDGRIVVLELAPPHAAPVYQADASGHVYLVERPPVVWESAFRKAGLVVERTPPFPQLGITLLRALGGVVDRVVGKAGAAPSGLTARIPAGRWNALKRRVARVARRVLLATAHPFDQWLGSDVTPTQYRHYAIFVLRRHG